MALMADHDLLGNLISLRTMERQVGAPLRHGEVQPPKPKIGPAWWRKRSTRERKAEQPRLAENPQGRGQDRSRAVALAGRLKTA